MEVTSCPMTPPLLPPPPPPLLPITTVSKGPLPPPPLPAPLLPPSAPPLLRPSLELGNGDESPEAQQPPQPRSRMRRLQWTKIPANRIAGRRTLWTGAENVLDQLDFERMEELFALPSQGQTVGSVTSGGGKGGTKYEDAMKKGRTKAKEEINILDSRRSLNVNVFLRQFRMSHSDLVEILARAESRSIGCEKLRGLLRILPTEDEVTRLKSYAGPRSRLGNAERFCLELMDLPSYAVKVEAMLVKEDFIQTVADRIRPALAAAILSVKDLNSNMALHEILHMVLMAGNFLNSGAASGNAAGFRLHSLLNLTEIRSNNPKMTLLHYVAWEAEKKKPHLLHFPEQLSHLKECSEHSLESLKTEVYSLAETITSVSERLKQTEAEFQQIMAPFIKFAKEQMVDLEKDMAELESLRLDLAAYLCEEETTFKLDECIKVFQSFCEKFNRAVKENKERNIEEKSCEKRRKSVEASQIRRQLRLNSVVADDEEVDVFFGTLLQQSDSANRSQLSRRSRSRSQSVSDFGRICDSFMVNAGDECNGSNDDKSIPRQCRSRTMNTGTKEPSSCLESYGELVEQPPNCSPIDLVKPFSDRIETASIAEGGCSGPITCSGPKRSDQIFSPSVNVSEGFIFNKMPGKRNSKSRLRRFAASFEDGRERIYTGEGDLGQRETNQEKSETAKGESTGRRIYVKTNSVDGSKFNKSTHADSFSENNGEGEASQIGDRDVRKNKSVLNGFYNGGQILERIGVRIGLELSSPVGAKLPFGVTDATFTVSVGKLDEGKDDGTGDIHQIRNSWELNSETNTFEKTGEASDESALESQQRKSMENDLKPKSGSGLEAKDQRLNEEQSASEQELPKKDPFAVDRILDESKKERGPNRNEIGMTETNVDVKDSGAPEDVAGTHSDNSDTDVQSEIIKDPKDPVLGDTIRTLTDSGSNENSSDVKECDNIETDCYGTKNQSDSMPSHELTNVLTSIQLTDDLGHDHEKHQENEAESSFSEKTSENQRSTSFKPKLSTAMKNRLQELSLMYSESDNEDWYSSSAKKTEPIDGIRKGSIKGTLICDMAKLSEFLCSPDNSAVQTLQKDDQVKKYTKIPSQASSRKAHNLGSAAETRSPLPRISSSSSSSSRRNIAASDVAPSSTSTKRVAKPVMPRTQPTRTTECTSTKAKTEQKKTPQRPSNDSKDASRKLISIDSPLTERKEIRRPVQTSSVFSRSTAAKISVVKGRSLVGAGECNALQLYMRTPASSSKSLRAEDSKSLCLKPLSSSGSAISRLGKTLEQPCSVDNRQHQNKASNRNLLHSRPTEKSLSSLMLPKTTLSRGFGSCNSKRESIDSNSSSDLLHALSSKNISRMAQSRDAKDNRAVSSKFGLQQNLTHSKVLENHRSLPVQRQVGLSQSGCAEEKQSKFVDNQQSTTRQLPRIPQSNSLEYQQQCLSAQSDIMEDLRDESHEEKLRTFHSMDRNGHKPETHSEQNHTSTECPPISKPTAKVAPLKMANTLTSGLPRKSSARSTSRQATK